VSKIIEAFIRAAVFCLVASLLLMVLWNTAMPEALGLRQLSFPNALSLFVICKILFDH
jgi:hypothetical protein